MTQARARVAHRKEWSKEHLAYVMLYGRPVHNESWRNLLIKHKLTAQDLGLYPPLPGSFDARAQSLVKGRKSKEKVD